MKNYLVNLEVRFGKVIGANFIMESGGVSVPVAELGRFLSANEVANIKIENGKFVGTQGNLKRYSKYPITVLEKGDGDQKWFRLYAKGKGVLTVTEEHAYKIIKKYGATNAKVVDREGKGIVSAIEGTFEDGTLEAKLQKQATRTSPESIKDNLDLLTGGKGRYIHLRDDKYLAIGREGMTFIDISQKKAKVKKAAMEVLLVTEYPEFVLVVGNSELLKDKYGLAAIETISVYKVNRFGGVKLLNRVAREGGAAYMVQVDDETGNYMVSVYNEDKHLHAVIAGNAYSEIRAGADKMVGGMNRFRRLVDVDGPYGIYCNKKLNLLDIQEVDGKTKATIGISYVILSKDAEDDLAVLDEQTAQKFGIKDFEEIKKQRHYGATVEILSQGKKGIVKLLGD